MEKMKILNISSARVQYPGGTEKLVWELSKYMVKQGHEVTILQTDLYEKGHKWSAFERKEGIDIITCRNDRFMKGFGYSKEFKEKLKEIWKDFDIIHIYGHGRFTSEYTLRFIKDKKPIVYSACGFFHNKKHTFAKRLYDKFFKKSARQIDFCTGLTEIENRRYGELGVPPNKRDVVPAWIDLEKFKKRKVNKEKLRKKYGIENKKTLLYVGRVHESKGLQHVVEAVKNLDVNFLIVGRDADFSATLNEQIKKYGVGDRVKLLGGLDDKDLLEVYSLVDVFILFSSWEGFGIVVLEAMAADLPVIVSDRGSLPTLIEHKENGLIAKYPNVKELRENIQLLLGDEKLEKKIKRNGTTFVKKFEYAKVSRQYEKIYEKLIKR
jgi:glycosyltransferase involved in cell wall biosynthesis